MYPLFLLLLNDIFLYVSYVNYFIKNTRIIYNYYYCYFTFNDIILQTENVIA